MIGTGLAGLGVGAGLIIAIGAQNAFVLRHGLMRHHVLAVCLFCAVSDAALIALGVAGFGTHVSTSPGLLRIVSWGGAVFLAVYGTMAFRRALNPLPMAGSAFEAKPLDQPVGETLGKPVGETLGQTLAACAAFTFLNPHVYLDTVVLVGGVSATYPGSMRFAFGAGAMLASFIWFFGLGYGARLLDGVFTKPGAWRILDTVIGFVMWLIAAKVVHSIL